MVIIQFITSRGPPCKDCFNQPWPSKTPKVHLRWLLDRFEVSSARLVENHRWRYRPTQPPMGRHFRGRVVGKHAPSLLPSFPIGISFSSGLFAGAMLAGVTQNDGLLVSKVDVFGLKIMAMWGWHLFVRFLGCHKGRLWRFWFELKEWNNMKTNMNTNFRRISSTVTLTDMNTNIN